MSVSLNNILQVKDIEWTPVDWDVGIIVGAVRTGSHFQFSFAQDLTATLPYLNRKFLEKSKQSNNKQGVE